MLSVPAFPSRGAVRAARRPMLAALILSSASGIAYAQSASPADGASQSIDLPEVVVSATGIPTPANQVASSVSVVTAEDIDRLIDVLRHVRDLASSSGQRLKRVRRVPR